MALLRTKLLAGALFAGLLFGAPETVQQGGGYVKFIPLRAAEVKVLPVRIKLLVGPVSAVGVSSPGESRGLQPTQVEKSVPSYTAPERAVETDTSASASVTVPAEVVKLWHGERGAEAGGFVQVGTTLVTLRVGDVDAQGGGYTKVPTEKMDISVGDVSAMGILNPTDEEIILIYRAVRRNRRLQS